MNMRRKVNDPFGSKLHEAQLTFNRRYDFFFCFPKVCVAVHRLSHYLFQWFFFPQ